MPFLVGCVSGTRRVSDPRRVAGEAAPIDPLKSTLRHGLVLSALLRTTWETLGVTPPGSLPALAALAILMRTLQSFILYLNLQLLELGDSVRLSTFNESPRPLEPVARRSWQGGRSAVCRLR